MQPREYDEIYQLEDFYWWFVGRRRLVRDLLRHHAPDAPADRPMRVLDAGCGTGGTMSVLDELADMYGCDLEWHALAYCRKRGFSRIAACGLEALSFGEERFDGVVSCDVLEHVEDDVKGLGEVYQCLRPGGVLVATVPAHPYLWSEHDDALAHVRRYERDEILGKLQEVGYVVEKFSAAVCFVFPIIFAFRMLQRLRPKGADEPKTDLRILPPLINRILVGLLSIETWLTRHISLPVGTSYVIVARRPFED
jgi:SAM-dependent methyltransferase